MISTTRKIKILYLITSLDIGGAERGLQRVLGHIDSCRYEFKVCSLLPIGQIGKELVAGNIRVGSLEMCSNTDINGAMRLFDVLRYDSWDIVHSHLFHANVLARTIGRLLNVPVIISTEHCPRLDRGQNRVLNHMTWMLAHHVIAVSENIRKFCITSMGVSEERISTIPLGIDTEILAPGDKELARRRLGVDVEDFVVALVNRLNPQKGVHTALKTARLVRDRIPRIRFIVCGDGPQRGELERYTNLLGVGSTVRFLGWVNDVRSVLDAADVYLLTSSDEGLPQSVAEAMAMGLPVIGTDVGGISELVTNEESGFLVPLGDASRFANALVTLADSSQLRGQMGGRGRERILRTYDVRSVAKTTERLYEHLVSRQIHVH